MLRRITAMLGFGVVWLFVYSIPIDAERKFFDVGYATIVDTKPMHWLINKLRNYFDTTNTVTTETVKGLLPKELERFSQAEQILKEQRP